MSKKLLIVESPAKAKTIEKYLGDDFKVLSSYGHIRDLDKGTSGVDIANNFAPKYVISPEKAKVVKELRDAKAKASEVWLATDEDREGEAISWHLCEVLGLNAAITKRIVFSEITKPAIQKAITQPRTVDIDLVNAQQARRILDRLVGFELSEILWRKVKGKLSAGRVQSVAVKLIVEKEREISNFVVESFYKINAHFDVKNDRGEFVTLKAELPQNFKDNAGARKFLEQCINAIYTVKNIEKKPVIRKPAAPFTTSTLQQEASRKLYFGVNKTMQVAQKLYESGHITYMRTDSTNLSAQAINDISTEIVSAFGNKYLKTRAYKSKSANAQEAHEAIRPTYIKVKNVSGDRDEQRLYELIWKRTIACQMADAELEKTIVTIGISTIADKHLVAEGEVMIFDGFLKVYLESSDDDESEETKGILPPLKIKDVLQLHHMLATERFTKPAARYTEASLVKKLEELGIGRPSTYAPTITKIMEKERGYVVKDSREGVERQYQVLKLANNTIKEATEKENTGAVSGRLFPTDIGMVVTDFLNQHFDEIMNYSFTAEVEGRLDEISSGNLVWQNVLNDFYGPFHNLVNNTSENADRAKGKRVLGVDPETGHSVIVQITRYGPVVQIGEKEELAETEKPKFANLKPGLSMESITFEQAMDLFKLPKTLGTFEGQEVIVNNGRFGPYVKFGETFINLGRAVDPMEITMEQAEVLIKAKIKEDAPIGTYEGLPITKGKGRFGPFVKWKDLFVNVPVKKYDFDNITSVQAIELIKAKVEKESVRFIKQWDKEKITIENGRWGPFIRFGKKMVKIPKINDEKPTAENLQEVTIEEVKAWIEAALPGSFKKK